MTKRDFEAIARVIRNLDPENFADWQRHDIATAFADWLESTNPRFDRERFLRACGVES